MIVLQFRKWLIVVLVWGGLIGIGLGWPQHAFGCTPSKPTHATSYVRFTDSLRQTSLTLQTDAHAADYRTFAFVTSGGAIYQGGPVTGLQTQSLCSSLITIGYQGATRLSTPTAAGQSNDLSAAQILMSAEIDLVHLTASVQLQDTTNHTAFQAVTKAPPDASATVSRYNQALISQDWATVYALSSQAMTQGYTETQFAKVFSDQVQQYGAITKIIVLSPPKVATNPAGIVYFTVAEQATLYHQAHVTTTNATSVFVLDGGMWKYWFSQTN